MEDQGAILINKTNQTENQEQLFETRYNQIDLEYNETYEELPKVNGWMARNLVQYQNLWLSPGGYRGTLMAQRHFQARTSDIISATSPKAGTTWFKSIIFAVVKRTEYEFSANPLLTTGPHDCVPFVEGMADKRIHLAVLNLPSPRVLSTHIPYHSLPHSVKVNGCKIVYACRDPKDALVSQWFYFEKLKKGKELPPLSLLEAYDLFRKGHSHFGPYWEHALGYWNASLESPNSVMFLNYEDMKMNPLVQVKRLAEFLGCPFSPEEEKEGKVREVVELCSFEKLSNLEVNKNGVQQFNTQFEVGNHNFFRKGIVGDWRNHLSEDMGREIDRITEEKFRGSGLKLPCSGISE